MFTIIPADFMALDPIDVFQHAALDDQMNLAILFKRGQVLIDLLDLFDRFLTSNFCGISSLLIFLQNTSDHKIEVLVDRNLISQYSGLTLTRL